VGFFFTFLTEIAIYLE